MARKSNLQMLMDAAIADASAMILRNTISSMGKNTTILELVNAIKGTQFADGFHAMTLSELAGAIQGDTGAAPTPRRGPGRPAKATAKAWAKAEAAPARKKSGKINTRTAEGRAELDAAIAAVLQANPGGLRSEGINKQVPGDTAQIRQSLKRMIDEGKVSRSGEKRATTYVWGGSARSKAPKRANAGAKKAGKKKAAKKRGAKKKATRKATKKVTPSEA